MSFFSLSAFRWGLLPPLAGETMSLFFISRISFPRRQSSFFNSPRSSRSPKILAFGGIDGRLIISPFQFSAAFGVQDEDVPESVPFFPYRAG